MIVNSRQTKPIAEEYLREQVVSIEHITARGKIKNKQQKKRKAK